MKLNKISIITVFAFLGVMSASAAAQQNEPGFAIEEDFTQHEEIPKVIKLINTEAVMKIRLVASDDGIDLTYGFTQGVPTMSIYKERDVVIEALGQSGKVVFSTSILNPRDARSIGPSNDPLFVVLPIAEAVVAFPASGDVTAVRIFVQRGANEGFDETFKLTPDRLINTEMQKN